MKNCSTCKHHKSTWWSTHQDYCNLTTRTNECGLDEEARLCIWEFDNCKGNNWQPSLWTKIKLFIKGLK